MSSRIRGQTWLLSAALGLAGFIGGLAPVGLAAMTWITGGGAALLAWRRPRGRVLQAAIVALVWMGLTAIWSLDPADTLGKTLETAGLLGIALAVAPLLPRLDPRFAARLLLGGMAIGAAIVLANELSDFALYRLINRIPSTEPVDWARLNRNAVALAMLAWPGAVAARVLLPRRLNRLGLGVPLAVLLLVAPLHSESAVVSLLAGGVFYGVASLSARLARGTLAVGLTIAMLGALPIAFGLKAAGADHWPELKISGQHRVEIWEFAAQRAMDEPLLGWGAHSFRHQAPPAPGTIPIGNDTVPLHPHSLFLQSWVELGAIGAALVLVFGRTLLRATRTLPLPLQPPALALFAAATTAEAFAFDMLQGYWIAMLVLSAWALLAVGCATAIEPAATEP